MKRCASSRHAIALLLLASTVVGSIGATWPPEKFTNLKVFPSDIPKRELIDTMAGFTRALGVRCTYCHVGEENQPLTRYQFELDDKETKRKAREMIRMVSDLNGKYLAALEHRADPPVRVQCATCHRGAARPRMLQDVLQHAYEAAGVDSALATYRALRAEFYGAFTYDFSEVPLSDVATRLWDGGHQDDALRFHALNVDMNPESKFAQRQHAGAALAQALRTQGVEAGTRTYRRLLEQYGPAAFPEPALIQTGDRFLGAGRVDLAIAVFRLAAEAFPKSSNAFDSLGEAYATHGERALAMESYRKALQLDPGNSNAKAKVEELGRAPAK
jgi:tetratricopeptide (TPR) repeat protein